jgi:hypothetical protein
MIKWNRSILTAAGMAALLSPFTLQAEVPEVDGDGVPAVVVCRLNAAGNPMPAIHMDKIIFRITGDLAAANNADQAALDDVPRSSRLDIKVLDDPTTVADLKGKVLTFLGALDNEANRLQIAIDDVDYAVVCRNPADDNG